MKSILPQCLYCRESQAASSIVSFRWELKTFLFHSHLLSCNAVIDIMKQSTNTSRYCTVVLQQQCDSAT